MRAGMVSLVLIYSANTGAATVSAVQVVVATGLRSFDGGATIDDGIAYLLSFVHDCLSCFAFVSVVIGGSVIIILMITIVRIRAGRSANARAVAGARAGAGARARARADDSAGARACSPA